MDEFNELESFLRRQFKFHINEMSLILFKRNYFQSPWEKKTKNSITFMLEKIASQLQRDFHVLKNYYRNLTFLNIQIKLPTWLLISVCSASTALTWYLSSLINVFFNKTLSTIISNVILKCIFSIPIHILFNNLLPKFQFLLQLCLIKLVKQNIKINL